MENMKLRQLVDAMLHEALCAAMSEEDKGDSIAFQRAEAKASAFAQVLNTLDHPKFAAEMAYRYGVEL